MKYEVYNGCQLLSTNAFPACCGSIPSVRLLLIMSEGELKYDIANVAYAQGDVARVHDNYGHDLLGDNNDHYMHQWKDVCEEGNFDRVRRTILIAVGDIEQMLYKFTQFALNDHTSIDNMPKEKREYIIELRVPYTFSGTTAYYLLSLAHEYIIDTVLEDWAAIAYPEAVPTWTAKKAEIAEKIKTAATTTGVHRHKVTPSII